MKSLRKIVVLAMALLLAGRVSLFATTPATPPLPALETVLQQALAQSKQEDSNNRGFKAHYAYKRLKLNEERDPHGKVEKQEQRVSEHIPNTPGQSATVAVRPDAQRTPQKRPLDKSDFSLDEDLISRFHITMVGREMVNGRPTLVLEFKPAAKGPPVRTLKDRFVNKAAGRLWLDERECVLVKTDLHLTESVSFVGGVAGAVKALWYHLDRERTPDGFWFNKLVNWRVEAREFLAHKTIEHKETQFDVRRVN